MINAGTGDDFVDAGDLGAIALGGAGDDLYLGGAGGDGPAGDQGDDWLEGGVGVDALSGDSGARSASISTPRVTTSSSAAAALTRWTAAAGLTSASMRTTWQSLTSSSADSDSTGTPTTARRRTRIRIWATSRQPTPRNIPAAFQDSFIDVEALSGGAGNDILRGDDRATLDTVTAGASDALVSSDLAKVQGLSTLLGSATSWSGGISCRWRGDDTLEGGGGNDLIDGDATLRVQLSVPTVGGRGVVDNLSAVRTACSTNTMSPSSIDIVRTLVPAPAATTSASSPGTSPRTR